MDEKPSSLGDSDLPSPSDLEREIKNKNGTKIANIREKLFNFINHLAIQLTVVIVVLLDLIVITALILIDQQVLRAPPSDPNALDASDRATERAETTLHVIQIVILCIFLAEVIVRVMSVGVDIIYDRWQIMDCIVVLMTFVLYMAFTGSIQDRTITYSVAYLITLRLWRMKRIYHELTEPIVRKAHRIIIAHRKAWRQAEEICKKQQVRMDQQQREIQLIKEQLRRLQKQKSTSVRNQNQRSHSLPRPMRPSPGDMMSSEEEAYETANPRVKTVTACVEQWQPAAPRKQGLRSPLSHNASAEGASSNDRRPVPDIVEGTRGISYEVEPYKVNDRRSAHSHHRIEVEMPDRVVVTNSPLDSGHSRPVSPRKDTAIFRESRERHSEKGSVRDSGIDTTAAMANDKQHLILVDRGPKGHMSRDHSYSNLGFAVESLTEEELMREIQRVSQVPFEDWGSMSVPVQDGIPMTDL